MKKIAKPLFAVFLLAAPAKAQALVAAVPSCNEGNAVAATMAHEKIAAFCAREVNGVSNGCDYKTRPPSELNDHEADNPDLAWVVTASIIHSWTEDNKPRFMPEGAAFAHISQSCEVIEVIGPWGPTPPVPE